ncbi:MULTISPECIES: hypothetical protein [unclassified Okeania]|uniref:hypothetical protein n=1 Tax=unclassified Okeania TaxID=2634635 RepID=UPI0013BC0DD6|nr:MULTISPECIES: hypothetical protein [unclassified Okeania]NEP05261.1 hypothetical protein [Okeania sp. SIO4D6]NEP39107.1 hypothetical protein [Okeania sp. SIO2H7]NET17622.1 hypothetical protein [Okeania sp. SIO1H6]NEP74046.1 hypothetical protein [Okeania sp. SIO2G5]NEP94891.1 hypothetical protein [Okeania sp. SIO2F5]
MSNNNSFTALERLDLSNNNLSGDLDLWNNNKLFNLNVENNKLTRVTLSADVKPLELNLSRNQLSEFNISSYEDLISADLSDNNLTSIGDLSKSNCNGDDDDYYGDCYLTELFLDNNKLKTIGSVSDLVTNGNLQKLSLRGNTGFQCSSLGLSTEKDVYKNSGCPLK